MSLSAESYLAMAYSSSFCSFHSEKELISFCLLAANSAEALLDLKELVIYQSLPYVYMRR